MDVKICDFGLSRGLTKAKNEVENQSTLYVVITNTLIKGNPLV
jgi:hypothetical protein